MLGNLGVLDHGHVQLVKLCAEDLDVVNAAKVSFNATVEEMDDHCIGLIKYLMRKRHGTPFEHTFFKFRVKAPIFVFREWHRHRVGHSYNEWSARYSKLEPEFYVPDEITTQIGKPGAYTFEPVGPTLYMETKSSLMQSYRKSYEEYEEMIANGIAKQIARSVLPVATYSEMIWSCNARSLMHFCGLRNAPDAQYEIQQYAKAAETFLETAMPVTYQAYIENGRTAP